MARKRQRERVSLPWERRRTRWSGIVRNPRWQAIIGTILLVILGASFLRYSRHKLRERDTVVAITQVKRAIARFRSDLGRCPISNEELVHPPRPQTHYIDEIPNDGWGRPLTIQCPGYFEDEADVTSAGPSGSLLKDDNIQ
ncbi:MAG: type II secretion system protein GspG [Myxococcota bacterium]